MITKLDPAYLNTKQTILSVTWTQSNILLCIVKFTKYLTTYYINAHFKCIATTVQSIERVYDHKK